MIARLAKFMNLYFGSDAGGGSAFLHPTTTNPENLPCLDEEFSRTIPQPFQGDCILPQWEHEGQFVAPMWDGCFAREVGVANALAAGSPEAS